MFQFVDQSGQLWQLRTLVVEPVLVATVELKLVLNLRDAAVPFPVGVAAVPDRSSMAE